MEANAIVKYLTNDFSSDPVYEIDELDVRNAYKSGDSGKVVEALNAISSPKSTKLSAANIVLFAAAFPIITKLTHLSGWASEFSALPEVEKA